MARPASIFAIIDSEAQRKDLVALWKEHSNHYTRMRAHAIILSDAGYEIEQIVEIFGVKRDSVRDWIKRFHQGGVDALLDDDRPGGPRKLDEDEEDILRDLLRQHPSRPAKVIALLRSRTGKSIGRDTLRR